MIFSFLLGLFCYGSNTSINDPRSPPTRRAGMNSGMPEDRHQSQTLPLAVKSKLSIMCLTPAYYVINMVSFFRMPTQVCPYHSSILTHIFPVVARLVASSRASMTANLPGGTVKAAYNPLSLVMKSMEHILIPIFIYIAIDMTEQVI
jgi:hypothetical protein